MLKPSLSIWLGKMIRIDPNFLQVLLLFLAGAFSSLTALPQALQAQQFEDATVVRIAFVADEINPFAAEIRSLVQQELLALTRDRIDVEFPAEFVVAVNDLAEESPRVLQQLVADDEVTMVITQGFLASEAAVRGAPWAKPVIASSVFDADLQGFPEVNGTSGVSNLTYIASPLPGPIVRDLTRFQELLGFSRAAIMVDEIASVTYETFIDQLLSTLAEFGIAIESVPIGMTAASGLERLSDDIEAVYVTPLYRMDPGEFEVLTRGFSDRNLPSFSYLADDVERGIMASLGSINLPLLARRIALNAYRILLGDAADTLPVTLVPDEELVLNMRIVRELDIVLPLEIILSAERLFEAREDYVRSVTIKSAMEEAMSANLSLAIEDQQLLSGAEDIRLARSNLLPNLQVSVSGATISKKLAESSLGMQPQYNIDSELILQQSIFSAEATANLSAQKSLQKSRQHNRDALKLDVGLEAAEAYLNVLRSKTLEQVQQDNLDLTLASLRMARQRERIGAAGPGERLRLESELARRRGDRIDAFAVRSAAEISLNQVVNRPLDEQFATPEADLEGHELLEGTLATGYLTNLNQFNQFSILSDFLVDTALRLSPEIQSLDAIIIAQEKLLTATRQAFYLPTVGLQGSVSTNVLRDGAGASSPLNFPVTERPDFPWSAGISISLPLFQGNFRSARRNQATAALVQAELQRELVAQRIEQNVRIQIEFARVSLGVVRESEIAARTAQQSLDLVTEAYGQGLVTVVDLLEAQTSVLLSDRNVANAIFDYLINLKRVEHAIGKFEAFLTPEEQINFIRQLDEYIQSSDGSP